MVFTPEPGRAKVMMSAAGVPLAAVMAARREPEPESFVLVTVNVAARTVTGATPKSTALRTREPARAPMSLRLGC